MTSIHSIWSRMEIKYRWFQDPGEPREGATQASQSEFWLASIWSAENVWPPRSNLEICSFSGLRSSLLRACTFGPWPSRAGMHGSVQTMRGLLACKQWIGDAIFRRSPGLPDLLLRPPARGGNSVWACIWSATKVIYWADVSTKFASKHTNRLY